jgi:hypothetical protein
MSDERLAEGERELMAVFERQSPPPSVWEEAVARAERRRRRHRLLDRRTASRPVSPRPLAAALALSVAVGVAGAVVGAHRSTGNGAPAGGGASAGRPAVSSTAIALARTMINGPGGHCSGVLGATQDPPGATGPGTVYAAYIETAPVACSTTPPAPGSGFEVAGSNPTVFVPAPLTPAPAGTYVVHLDSCTGQRAAAVTVEVDAQRHERVVRVAGAPHGEAIAHGSVCSPVPISSLPPLPPGP